MGKRGYSLTWYKVQKYQPLGKLNFVPCTFGKLNAMKPSATAPRTDWKTERERIDLAAVATSLLGPAPGRRGERGRKLWWNCPFHPDANPSFCVEPGKPWWKCWGCGESGDAATLVMRLEGKSFLEAVVTLTGGSPLARRATTKPATKPTPVATGLPEADALALVEASETRLWSKDGRDLLAYLTGPRCLAESTIRAARLGWTDGVMIPRKDKEPFHATGWVIPWFNAPRLALVKIRQPEGRIPKYAEAFRDPARLISYPTTTVLPGKPLVIVEGEFDALLLGEALGEAATVVTLGGASAPLTPAITSRFMTAPTWYTATDADPAGDKAAQAWPTRARRIRPPEPYKDWTEARSAGVNLGRWWRDILAGVEKPKLFSWDELKTWRWGRAEETLGIEVP